MIIIGSTALEYFNLNRQKPKDIDVFYREGEIKSNASSDSHILPAELYDLIEYKDGYATPDMIYTLKCSHFSSDIHWLKTKNDILWLKAKGCNINLLVYEKFKNYWLNFHKSPKSQLSLMKTKNEFFNDYVTYVYDHDKLHTAIAYPDKPMYTKCLADQQEVLIDKLKFDTLSYEEKIRLFREEITVIALERWIIDPIHKGKVSILEAYQLALKKTIISLTKNWATDFIIFNIDKFIKPDYKLFLNASNIPENVRIMDDNKLAVNTFKPIATELINTINLLIKNKYNENEVIKLDGGNLIINEYDNDTKDLFSRLAYHLANDELDEFFEYFNFFGMDVTDYTLKKLRLKYDIKVLDLKLADEFTGSVCTSVFKINDLTFKCQWDYNSGEGSNYDNIMNTLKLVTPVKKQVIVYE